MSRELHDPPLARCLLVWTAVSGAGLVLLRALADPIATAGRTFDSLLVAACAAALAGCVVWCWATTSLVVGQALTGARLPARPGVVRRAVLVACGVATLAASPAAADPAGGSPGHAETHGPTVNQVARLLDGLPLPTRPATPIHRDPPTVTVEPGDNLWTIAERTLPGHPTAAEIDVRWREIWAANRHTVGLDPDVIHPGARLRLPREES